MPAPGIHIDATCECGYNLRGLTLDHRCPECGRPAHESVKVCPYGVVALDAAERSRRWVIEGDLFRVASETPYPHAAFLLVCHSLEYAFDCAQHRGHVTAAEWCAAMREYARARFGGAREAMARLNDWKIRSSDDVGEIVSYLIANKLLEAAPDDAKEQFRGLFTLDDLFDAHLELPRRSC
jgi:uncharacterized repeat protein (TIGR04138 family)